MYIPALGLGFLTPFYDAVLRLLLREMAIKRRLVLEAAIQPGQRVLDLGCGTGTLTILIKQMHPAAEVIGLDPDQAVLSRATQKAAARGVRVTFIEGSATHLHYPDAHFDRVLSSLVFHHLTTSEKSEAASEVHRVLAPSGRFLLLDIGPPRNLYASMVSRILARLEHADDNIRGILPAILEEAHFLKIQKIVHFETLFGTLTMLRAIR